MKNLVVFDPPMCCSTDVCGPIIDPVLPRFVADLPWLANQGVNVSRHNLSQEPQAFAANELLKAALTNEGNNCLPLILVNGQIASMGLYPDRQRLAQMMGIQTSGMGQEQPHRARRRLVQGLRIIHPLRPRAIS